MQKTNADGASGPLVYHTFYAEYRGNTPEELVAALHKDSETGTGMDYAAWWAWQKKLWATQANVNVPAPDEPGACTKLISILVNVGALETGPRPAPAPTSDRAPR